MVTSSSSQFHLCFQWDFYEVIQWFLWEMKSDILDSNLGSGDKLGLCVQKCSYWCGCDWNEKAALHAPFILVVLPSGISLRRKCYRMRVVDEIKFIPKCLIFVSQRTLPRLGWMIELWRYWNLLFEPRSQGEIFATKIMLLFLTI